jgi:hypothetical protein
MIKSLRLKNFKGFENLDLPEVSNITLIGGRNNVGKSSLLEAIFLFYDIGNPGMFLRHLTWRGVELSSLDADTTIAPIFRDFDMDHPLTIAVSDEIYRSEMKVTFNPNYTQKSISIDLPESGTTIPQVQIDFAPLISYALDISYQTDGRSELKTQLVVRQSPTNVNVQFEPNLTQGPPDLMRKVAVYLGLRMKVDPGEEAVRFGKLDIDRRSDRVIEFLKILEPNLVGLSAVPGVQKSMMYADIGMDRKIPIAYLGDGVSRLLSIILAIATAKNGVVLIDEIDAGIHHSMMAKVWEGICSAAREFNCQIIATTHSYEALQTAYDGVLKADMARNFRYIRLDRQEKDIVGKSYTHKVLGAALDHGWEVR